MLITMETLLITLVTILIDIADAGEAEAESGVLASEVLTLDVVHRATQNLNILRVLVELHTHSTQLILNTHITGLKEAMKD